MGQALFEEWVELEGVIAKAKCEGARKVAVEQQMCVEEMLCCRRETGLSAIARLAVIAATREYQSLEVNNALERLARGTLKNARGK